MTLREGAKRHEATATMHGPSMDRKYHHASREVAKRAV